MNARTQLEFILGQQKVAIEPSSPALVLPRVSEGPSPVVKHLDHLQSQLGEQIDHLNNVVVAMQRINNILERMAAKKCKLNRPRLVDER